MRTEVMFLDCPAYMDRHGAVRCGLPAEVEQWYAVRSTDGPLGECKDPVPTRPYVQTARWSRSPGTSTTIGSRRGRAGYARSAADTAVPGVFAGSVQVQQNQVLEQDHHQPQRRGRRRDEQQPPAAQPGGPAGKPAVDGHRHDRHGQPHVGGREG